jgi:hypothetical protein
MKENKKKKSLTREGSLGFRKNEMSKYVENIDRDNSCNENQKSKIESP